MYNLEIRQYFSTPKFEKKIDFPFIPSNDQFLQVLDEINIKISYLISKRNHKLLFKIFDYFLDCENFLTNRINLLKRKNIPIYSVKKYTDLIELRNYYNNFRILLISQVAEYLLNTYNNIIATANNNLLKSTQLFSYYKKVNIFYIHQIKSKIRVMNFRDSFLDAIKLQQYNETLKIFLELESLLTKLPKSKKMFFALLSI